MDLSVVFLGTGGSVPSARRATACVLIRAGGSRVLIDAGEGAQRQMIASTGLVQVEDIYITHFHADHYLGLPGLLKTYDLMERQAPLRIVGPAGLHDLFEALRRIFGRLRYEVELVELEPGEGIEHDGFEMRAFPVEHRMKALGYAYVEPRTAGPLRCGCGTRTGHQGRSRLRPAAARGDRFGRWLRSAARSGAR